MCTALVLISAAPAIGRKTESARDAKNAWLGQILFSYSVFKLLGLRVGKSVVKNRSKSVSREHLEIMPNLQIEIDALAKIQGSF